ncbi:MAG: hypothetical protein M3R51_08335 [Candidatus Eremiobacteraeota bacterium]|nr:hypothetical protein [Candidatus Eremiobacteraeota bacterium]
MQINAATANALDYIADRGADAARAFVPGARPKFGDVEVDKASRVNGDPLSVATEDGSYFVTTDERGRTAYTQNGALAVDGGTIVASNGRPILGYARPSGVLEELHADPVDLALGRVRDVGVGPDGSVGYLRASIDPRTGLRENERVVIGCIAVAKFPAGTKLSFVDAERSIPPQGVVPHTGRPGDGNFAPLSPGRRAASHIDLEASLSHLSDAYLAFDALASVHKAQGSVAKTAMDLVK